VDGRLIQDEKFNPAAFAPLLLAALLLIWWWDGMMHVGQISVPEDKRIVNSFMQAASTMTPTVAGVPTVFILGASGLDFELDLFPATPTVRSTPAPTSTYAGFAVPDGWVAPAWSGASALVTPYCVTGERCDNVISETREPLVALPTMEMTATRSTWFVTFTPVPSAEVTEVMDLP
jgi:hypothetical protein